MRNYYLLILFVTIAAISGWFYIYSNVSPILVDGSLNNIALLMFMGTLGISITGVYTLAICWVKMLLYPAWDPVFVIRASIRQGVLLSGGIVLSAFLAFIGSLNWVTGGLTVATSLMLELFFRR